MSSSARSKAATQVIELLVKIAHYVEPVDHGGGRIKMRVPFSDLPKLLALVAGIDVDESVKSIPGFRSYEVSPWTMSATIRYDPSVLPFDLWNDFCAIKTDPVAETSFRERFLALLENHSG
jgi:hypothetical protein